MKLWFMLVNLMGLGGGFFFWLVGEHTYLKQAAFAMKALGVLWCLFFFVVSLAGWGLFYRKRPALQAFNERPRTARHEGATDSDCGGVLK